MATKYVKKRAFTYKEVVLKALEKHFTSQTHIGFTTREITRKVILEIMDIKKEKETIEKKIRKEIHIESVFPKSPEEFKKTLKNRVSTEFKNRCNAMMDKVYPNVHREIKKALGKEIIEISRGRYAPNNLQFERNGIIDKIVFNVDFLREDTLVVSSRMVVVQVSEETMHIAKALFTQLLKENRFSVASIDNNLILLLSGDPEECKKLIISIVDFVKESYQIRETGYEKRLTRLKRKKEF